MTKKEQGNALLTQESAKQALFKYSSFQNALIKNLQLGVIFQHMDGTIAMANPAAQEILGFSEEEMCQFSRDNIPWKLTYPNGAPLLLRDFPSFKTIATGLPQKNVVAVLTKKNGRTVWLKMSSELVSDDESGQRLGVVSNFEDISEERNDAIKLQNIKDRQEVAVDSAEMGVWEWIPSESLMIWDARVYEMHGFAETDAISVTEAWVRSVHPDDKHRVQHTLWAIPTTDNSLRKIEYRVIWPDGSIHYLRAHARSVRHEDEYVGKAVGVVRDVTKDTVSEKKLWDLAYTDSLTGAFSRASLSYRVSRSLVRAGKTQTNFSVMMIGLTRFKEINDNYGIAIGDRVLVQVANRLKVLLHEDDSLIRVGGDEFVIILESLQHADGFKIFYDTLQNLVLAPVEVEHGGSITIDAKAGVSFYPKDGTDAVTLQTRAGLAMHQAKANQSDEIVFYDPQMSDVIRRKYNLKYQLRSAIDTDELQLFYQPIVKLFQDESIVVGCEALIRWRDAQGNFISPMEFIPVAEESGLIYDLGLWINMTAVKQWKSWQESIPNLRYISINVSPHQLEKKEFMKDLMELIDEFHVRPENIQLEITEGTFLKETMNAAGTLARLANYGFRLAIDDFGTGYSSLAYLKRFNVDVIKIDRSFIRDIEVDESDRDIVNAILAMNKKLGFKTLVEGVETVRQHEIITELGCESAQGYFYGRPVSADDFFKTYFQNDSSQVAG